MQCIVSLHVVASTIFERIIMQSALSAVDIQKLTYSALVLAMIFSTGEAVPLQCYGKLNSATTAASEMLYRAQRLSFSWSHDIVIS